MDEPTVSTEQKSPRRAGWIVAVVALAILTLVFATRSMSPHLSVGTEITSGGCQSVNGGPKLCERHVERGEWLILAPIDDYQVYVKDNSRHFSVGNPWVDDSKRRVIAEESGFTFTDGQVAVQFTPQMIENLKD